MSDTTDTRDIDRRIAARLGWRIEPDKHEGMFYTVYAPNGRQMGIDDNGHWSYAIHPKYFDQVIPAFSADLNAAIGLVETFANDFRLELTHDGWEAGLVIYANDKARFLKTAPTPALAICYAWEAYMDAQEAVHGDH